MTEIKKAVRPDTEEVEQKPVKKPVKKKAVKKKAAKKKVRAIDNLNAKHKEFLLNYFALGMNGRKAYMKTYPNTKPQTADVMASRMLSNVKVKAARQEYLEERWENKEAVVADIFDKLTRIANSDIAEFLDEAGKIKTEEFENLDTYVIGQYDKSISDTATGRNVKQSIKLLDKQKAIDTLTKILGMIKDEPPKLEIVISPAEKPEE